MKKRKKVYIANRNEQIPGEKLKFRRRGKNKEKIKLIIQIRGGSEEELLKLQVPSTASVGQIKKYLSEKYGEDGEYLYLTQLKPNKSEGKKSSGNLKKIKEKKEAKVELVIKTLVGNDTQESKFRISRDIKIKALKDGLAHKFKLSPDDFELYHVKNI